MSKERLVSVSIWDNGGPVSRGESKQMTKDEYRAMVRNSRKWARQVLKSSPKGRFKTILGYTKPPVTISQSPSVVGRPAPINLRFVGKLTLGAMDGCIKALNGKPTPGPKRRKKAA